MVQSSGRAGSISSTGVPSSSAGGDGMAGAADPHPAVPVPDPDQQVRLLDQHARGERGPARYRGAELQRPLAVLGRLERGKQQRPDVVVVLGQLEQGRLVCPLPDFLGSLRHLRIARLPAGNHCARILDGSGQGVYRSVEPLPER
jgi:hypothetical protein